MRATRTINQTVEALGLPPVPPLVGGWPGDPHLGRDMRDWASRLDPQDHREPTDRGQTSVTVHSSLLSSCVASTAPHSLRGLNSSRDQRQQRSWSIQLASEDRRHSTDATNHPAATPELNQAV